MLVTTVSHGSPPVEVSKVKTDRIVPVTTLVVYSLVAV